MQNEHNPVTTLASRVYHPRVQLVLCRMTNHFTALLILNDVTALASNRLQR